MRKVRTKHRETQLLHAALGRLEAFEGAALERLARVEENLRLLRQELVGNGRPGRIAQLESQVDHLRSAHTRERGVIAGISLTISLLAALLSRWLPQ